MADSAQENTQNTSNPQEGPRLPEPTLTTLATMLGMQAMSVIGMVAIPGKEKSEPRPNEAKHLIDLIEMLFEKTQGNRTPEETKELDDLLHGLRMMFVNVMQQHRQETMVAKNES
ncbi:MAG: DUF1844 domain-containing protein [Thermoguttaceae bacterium]|nr:DUF1844 domain-containing protein [Thermoguttaceae bacterium]